MSDQAVRQNQVLKLNRSPLGVLAKECLKHLQVEEVDEYCLYPLQVVQAILEGPTDKLPLMVKKNLAFLQDQTAIMSNWDPNFILALLLQPESGESIQDSADQEAVRLKGKSPEEIGAILAENLVFSLAERRPHLLGPTTEQ
jgi:hypothetical protein